MFSSNSTFGKHFVLVFRAPTQLCPRFASCFARVTLKNQESPQNNSAAWSSTVSVFLLPFFHSNQFPQWDAKSKQQCLQTHSNVPTVASAFFLVGFWLASWCLSCHKQQSWILNQVALVFKTDKWDVAIHLSLQFVVGKHSLFHPSPWWTMLLLSLLCFCWSRQPSNQPCSMDHLAVLQLCLQKHAETPLGFHWNDGMAWGWDHQCRNWWGQWSHGPFDVLLFQRDGGHLSPQGQLQLWFQWNARTHEHMWVSSRLSLHVKASGFHSRFVHWVVQAVPSNCPAKVSWTILNERKATVGAVLVNFCWF